MLSLSLMILGILVLMIYGIPVSISILIGSIIYLFLDDVSPLIIIIKMADGIDSFILLAVPCFIFAGNLMNAGKITDRIFTFISSLFATFRGGLGYVNVIASTIFAGMSGAAVADVGGLGNMEIKAMRKAGYSARISVGITAASSVIGPIIPPSIPIIVYAYSSDTSVGKLFAAGFIPGVIMALMLMIFIFFKVRNEKEIETKKSFDLRFCFNAFLRAFMAIITPIIIIGGIYSGIFTPTESAVAAVMYALFLGLVVYKSLSFKGILKISIESVRMSSSILLIIAASTLFSWILVSNGFPQEVAEVILGITDNPILIIIIINLILLFAGCFLDAIGAITVLTPIFIPIVQGIGMDMTHFGIIMVLNLMIGLLTPPLGIVLYVLKAVSGIPFSDIIKGTLPFMIPLFISLILISFIPEISLWLPHFLGY